MAEVNISGFEIADAFVISALIVVLDEGLDGPLEFTRQVVVLEQDPVLHCLMLAFDLPLRLRVVRCATNMIHAQVMKPCRQVVGDVG